MFDGRKSGDPAWGVMAFRSRPLAKPSLQKVFFAHGKELPNWKDVAKVRCEGSERVQSGHRHRPISSIKTMPTKRADDDILGLQEIFQIF